MGQIGDHNAAMWSKSGVLESRVSVIDVLMRAVFQLVERFTTVDLFRIKSESEAMQYLNKSPGTTAESYRSRSRQELETVKEATRGDRHMMLSQRRN